MNTPTHNVELSLAQTISNVEAMSPGAINRILVMAKGCQFNQQMYGQQYPNYGQMYQSTSFNSASHYSNASHFDPRLSDHNQYFLSMVDDFNARVGMMLHEPSRRGRILLLCPSSSGMYMYVLSAIEDSSNPGGELLLLTEIPSRKTVLSSINVATREISRSSELPTEMSTLLRYTYSEPDRVNVHMSARDCWLSIALSRFYRPIITSSSTMHYSTPNTPLCGTINWGGVAVTKNVLDWFAPNIEILTSINKLLYWSEDDDGGDKATTETSNSGSLQAVINRFTRMLDAAFEVVLDKRPDDVIFLGQVSTISSNQPSPYFVMQVIDGIKSLAVWYYGHGYAPSSHKVMDEILDFFDLGRDGFSVKWATEPAPEYHTETCAVFKEAVDSGVPISTLVAELKATNYGTGRSMFDWLFGSEENRELLKQLRSLSES